MRGDDSSAVTAGAAPSGGRALRNALRAALVLFAVVWLTVGFGVIDLVSGFVPDGKPAPSSIAVLSAAYGAVAGIVIPAAFLADVRAPQRWSVASAQLAVVLVAFALAGIGGLDALSFVSVGTLLGMLGLLLLLRRTRPRSPRPAPMSRPVLLLAAVGAVPWLAYALDAASAGRGNLPPDTMAARPQAGGWAGASVMALTVVMLALLAGRTPVRRLPLWSAAVTSVAFGVASALHPEAPGSAGRAWGVLAVAWGVALLATGEVAVRRRTAAGAAEA